MDKKRMEKKPLIVDVVDQRAEWVREQTFEQQQAFLNAMDRKFPKKKTPKGLIERMLRAILILCLSSPGALPGLYEPPSIRRLRDGSLEVSWDLYLVPFVRDSMKFTGKKKKIERWVTFSVSPGTGLVTMSQRYSDLQMDAQMGFFIEALPATLDSLFPGQESGDPYPPSLRRLRRGQ